MNEPWLIEPEDIKLHFLYLKTPGFRLNNRNLDECPTKNRIVVYSAANPIDRTVVCPAEVNSTNTALKNQKVVDLISGGWNLSAVWDLGQPLTDQQQNHARSFVVEFLQQEPGYYVVTWMAISKRLLTSPSATECPYRLVFMILLLILHFSKCQKK